MSGENLVYTVVGGGMPTLTAIPAYMAGQHAKVGVRQETNRLMVEAVVVEGGGGTLVPAVFSHGTKTVTTAGTPVAISSTATAYLAVIIVPLRTNTGYAYVGSNSATGTQHIISPWMISAPPGESINLANLYVDSTVNGEGIAWEAIT